jgi:hypothetical protein
LLLCKGTRVASFFSCGGKVPQATGQSDELAPQRHISWRGAGSGEEITTVSSSVLISPLDNAG